MIPWLRCLIFGHHLDIENRLNVQCWKGDKDDGIKTMALCKKCKRYKSVY